MTTDIRNYSIRTRLELAKKRMGLKNREDVIDRLLSESLLKKPKPLRKIIENSRKG